MLNRKNCGFRQKFLSTSFQVREENLCSKGMWNLTKIDLVKGFVKSLLTSEKQQQYKNLSQMKVTLICYYSFSYNFIFM